MKKLPLFLAASLLSSPVFALTLSIKGIENNTAIAEKFAFCAPDGKGKTKNGGNLNPEIRWKDVPEGTKSFAIVMVDGDVPTKFDNANKAGKTIASDFPRQNFYHWLVVDIPASRNNIAEGEDSSEHKVMGKAVGVKSYGVVGQNDYASFMTGAFGGYDGPCPPWNDARLHHYRFQLYALSTEKTGLSGVFNGKQVMEAITPHIVAKAEVVGTFTNNPAVK